MILVDVGYLLIWSIDMILIGRKLFVVRIRLLCGGCSVFDYGLLMVGR